MYCSRPNDTAGQGDHLLGLHTETHFCHSRARYSCALIPQIVLNVSQLSISGCTLKTIFVPPSSFFLVLNLEYNSGRSALTINILKSRQQILVAKSCKRSQVTLKYFFKPDIKEFLNPRLTTNLTSRFTFFFFFQLFSFQCLSFSIIGEKKMHCSFIQGKNSCISVVQQISGFIYTQNVICSSSHKCQAIGPHFPYKPITQIRQCTVVTSLPWLLPLQGITKHEGATIPLEVPGFASLCTFELVHCIQACPGP